MAVIEVYGLSRRYGDFSAVRDVSFSVERGELFALLGTNGAGKTSTLELVEGLARPSGGTVRILGHDPVARRSRVRPRTGVMLQDAGFPGDLTVVEVARMWAGTLTAPRPVPEALTLAGLDHRAGVRVRQLSGGERRRLDLALAILGRPEVLVLDEPTTGLDPQSRRDAWNLLRGLVRDGVTVLLSTHYLEEAEELADRLAIMHRGTVVAAGTVREVVAAHPSRITFGLPAGVEPPTLPGAAVRERGRVVVQTDTLQPALLTLLTWADHGGVELAGLDARSASLEEVFLSIAGEPR
ncbi:ABC transporter ATP-binding protein [Dactylosporangium sucinum]|uniref:Multidrug ABC transporter ATP-binding protein n=1 Tax=Dactylosporangium sucinum TaxID=1424081 RepID=A0A917TNH2_9ACTN|nr:ABC transporter ATP-binding protein [Dactylosporangium sucinum]GGM30374.1 multidrug ABC transporter ATP-binding protein [Dactylosporangium sucinum]